MSQYVGCSYLLQYNCGISQSVFSLILLANSKKVKMTAIKIILVERLQEQIVVMNESQIK